MTKGSSQLSWGEWGCVYLEALFPGWLVAGHVGKIFSDLASKAKTLFQLFSTFSLLLI